MNRLLSMALFAACGGAGGENKPVEVSNTASASPAARTTGDEVLAKITAFKEKACVCEDKPCAAKVKAELDAWAQRPTDPLADERIDAVVIEYDACIDALLGYGAEVERYAEMKNLMCACTTKACANRIDQRFQKWGTLTFDRKATRDMPDPPAEAVVQAAQHSKALEDCLTKVLGETITP